ncbi:MAG: hypothetical protein NWE89_01340 [Candidatus Bathyarchaeota archaeon]|nr:hypothetical protein [Candidatus Bathyarchaeota archaeon]
MIKKENFEHYIGVFDDAETFSGPSLYFHFRTLERARNLGSLETVLNDELFLEYLYATLASWGLHRMGETSTKLVDFRVLRGCISSCSPDLIELGQYELLNISENQLDEVNQRLGDLISKIKISVSSTQLVAGSKAIHHILPEIVPPIDRNYVIRFFYGRGGTKQVSMPTGGARRVFKEMFPIFHYIGQNNKEEIEGFKGQGFHTSSTKVIDNAIIGFVIENLPKK